MVCSVQIQIGILYTNAQSFTVIDLMTKINCFVVGASNICFDFFFQWFYHFINIDVDIVCHTIMNIIHRIAKSFC